MILPEYLATVFLTDKPADGWPECFHIITAHNPGKIVDDKVNAEADDRLKNELNRAGGKCFRITGCSPDLFHRERGWGVSGLSREDALRIAREFGQNALFEVEDGVLTVIGCLSGEKSLLGNWESRIHPKPGEFPAEKARLEFQTTSGRKVRFEAIHIEVSTLGWMEGSLFLHREHVLERMTKTVERKFGGTGLHLHEPPPGPLPAFTIMAQFHCSDPMDPSFDCSSLTLVWFSDSLPTDLPGELRERFTGTDWEAYAKDCLF